MRDVSAALEDRWRALWSAAGAPGDPGPAWRDLERRWSEPHRAYHGLAHLAQCLDELEPARSLAESPVDVELALWFHDAVHDTRRPGNEERSAELARSVASTMGRAPESIERVVRLILATRHDAVPAPGDEALVVDVDLAILGQPRERFEEYEREIRREYSWVPGPIFRMKRAQVLRSFLERAAIYSTPHFRALYEQAARENLRRSLGLAAGCGRDAP